MTVRERNFTLTDVYNAEEAFVTGTFAGLVPVREVDGRTHRCDATVAVRWSNACRAVPAAGAAYIDGDPGAGTRGPGNAMTTACASPCGPGRATSARR
jgi:hypothetical protein